MTSFDRARLGPPGRDEAAALLPKNVHTYLHEHGSVLVTAPLRILVVIVVALVVRVLAHRAIDRLTRSTSGGSVPRLLSPLKERAAAASALFDAHSTLSERRRQRADTIGSVLKSAVSVTVFTFAFLVILGQIGIDIAALIAGTSIIGVAVAFGAQNVIKDFLSGMFMILEDQYGVGDVIDVGSAVGTVEAVGLRTTRLRDDAGTVWYVRNGEITRVGNESQGFAQVLIDVPIAASADLGAASAAILGEAQSLFEDPQWHGVFLGEPELQGVQEITREQTVIRVVVRVRPLEQWRVGAQLRGRIHETLLRMAAAAPDGDPADNDPADNDPAGVGATTTEPPPPPTTGPGTGAQPGQSKP